MDIVLNTNSALRVLNLMQSPFNSEDEGQVLASWLMALLPKSYRILHSRDLETPRMSKALARMWHCIEDVLNNG